MHITTSVFLLGCLAATEASESSTGTHMIIVKDGRRYYDLALAESPELVLDDGHEGTAAKVWGVTVVGGECGVERLILKTTLVLDDVVVKKCLSLRRVIIEGNLICARIFGWVENFASKMDIQGLNCTDVKCYTSIPSGGTRVEICALSNIKDYSPFKERMCPEMCQRCISYIDINGSWTDSVIVTCENARLTEFNLPTLPTDTESLFLPGNQIQSATKLLNKLEYLTHLRLLDLSNNQVTSIPYLPSHAHPSLNKIFLIYNKITELDVEAAESLFQRDLELKLHGNQLVCGCHLYFVNKLYMKYCADKSRCIFEYKKYRCFSESKNRTLPMWEMNNLDGCELEPFIIDFWILLIVVLIILNAIMFWLIGDMVFILWRCKGFRQPKMVCLVKFLSSLFDRLRPLEEPKGQDIADVIDQSSYVRSAMLRSRRSW